MEVPDQEAGRRRNRGGQHAGPNLPDQCARPRVQEQPRALQSRGGQYDARRR